jgi:asparagine synthase (glutamine-hydrolysing)
MCGITGIWKWNGAPVTESEIAAFTYTLRHRGPDGQGIYLDATGALALGHRRLAILDLSSTGHQPMSYSNHRYWLTFNGEIYNFIELRHELEMLGHQFVGQSDSEIILAAYQQWGPDCQHKFNGMWAFAIWDQQERRLFLSRDRFGIKPLYYLLQGHLFAFASEYKAFLALVEFVPQFNRHRLNRTLVDPNSAEDGPETLLTDVFRLPAGSYALVTPGQVRVRQWWSTLDHLPAPPSTLAQQAEHFRELFWEACALRMRSDVPIGTCLSGGIDSSAVICTLAAIRRDQSSTWTERQATDWQRAFTATFPGESFDEQIFARQAVAHSGARPCYLPITPDAATEYLEEVVFQVEDILTSLPTSTWLIYRELRRHQVVVSLDGHGADELLAGYPYHAFNAVSRLKPWQAGRVAAELAAMFPNGKEFKPRNALQVWLSQLPGTRSLYRSFGTGRLLRLGVIVDYLTQEREWRTHNEIKTINHYFRHQPITRGLYHDFHIRILPYILRNFDRCSMAHGIEVRMPFMDWRLVTYAFALPDRSKFSQGYTKLVLREAMVGVIPDSLRLRKTKVGFGSPMVTWFEGPLRPWLEAVVNSPAFLESDLWDGPRVRRYIKRRMVEGWLWRDIERVWPLLQTHLWLQMFIERRQPRQLELVVG